MELSNLKKRLLIAKRGHKLLKEKQNELVRRFIQLARENKSVRIKIENNLIEVFQMMSMAEAFVGTDILEQALSTSNFLSAVDIRTKNIMSVQVPKIDLIQTIMIKDATSKQSIYPYGYANTSVSIDFSLEKLKSLLEELIHLAEIEKSFQLLADEIEKTRRRVNALEYKTIPDLIDTIRFIRMKLEEDDRATTTRLIKVKSLILNQD
jgi:V/A-type H+-transporting ATPase subunit D